MFGVAPHVADEFVVLGQRVRDLAGEGRQARDERLDLEVRDARFGFEIAHRTVPPEAILDDGSPDVGARVAELVDTGHVAPLQSAPDGDTAHDLAPRDFYRL